jgi:hypothetical protein
MASPATAVPVSVLVVTSTSIGAASWGLARRPWAICGGARSDLTHPESNCPHAKPKPQGPARRAGRPSGNAEGCGGTSRPRERAYQGEPAQLGAGQCPRQLLTLGRPDRSQTTAKRLRLQRCTGIGIWAVTFAFRGLHGPRIELDALRCRAARVAQSAR